MSKFQSIYGKVRSELVILGGSILAAIGLVAALTTGTVHTVAQDALPIAALVIAVVTRNRVFSAATVADLVATAKSIAALKAARPDQTAQLPRWAALPYGMSASAPVPPVAASDHPFAPFPIVGAAEPYSQIGTVVSASPVPPVVPAPDQTVDVVTQISAAQFAAAQVAPPTVPSAPVVASPVVPPPAS